MNKSKPVRLAIAQMVCRYLPPIISQGIRARIYPRESAYQDNFVVSVRAQTGSVYCGSTADHHGYPFSVHGYSYWRAWAIALAICSAGDTIIEIGANVGTETIGFSDIVGCSGSVIAFEPLPANIAVLNKVMKQANYQNINIHPVAVGDANETVLFSVPALPYNSGIGHILRDTQSVQGENIEVQCVTLDSFIDKDASPRLIFMDVEGSEIRVLRGARKIITQHTPVLVLEASAKLLKRAGFTMGDLLSEIENLGYLPFGISRLDLVALSEQPGSAFANWVCLPEPLLSLRPMISRSIRRCGLIPCVPGMNPMTQS